MLMDISKIYPNGVEPTGLKANYNGQHTKLQKKNITIYAKAHTLDKASKKYNVNRNTIAYWISEYNKGLAY